MTSTRPASGTWVPDVLGEGFEQCTLERRSGGPATLVRHRPSTRWPPFQRRRTFVVLYVHGWSDYFFQTDLARFWYKEGAAFYAIDLHNYGRSLRPGLVPGFVTDLQEYDEDLEAALDHIRADGHAALPLVMLGHSTGGLTLSLWVARNPGTAAALVLNSPWLEFQASGTARKVITPFLGFEARRHPLAPLPPVDRGIYARALREASDGHVAYNQTWRPLQGFSVPLAFLYAVMRGQAAVEEGLHLNAPVLVLLSDRSYLQPTWSSDASSADVALNVDLTAHSRSGTTSRLREYATRSTTSFSPPPNHAHTPTTPCPDGRTTTRPHCGSQITLRQWSLTSPRMVAPFPYRLPT